MSSTPASRRVVAVASCLASALAVGVAFAAGCSSTSGGGGNTTGDDAGTDAAPIVEAGTTCPELLPPVCPTPEPSYATDVLPILEQRCYTCHADGGVSTSGSGLDLGSYAQVYKLRGDVVAEVNACRMPPSTAPQPTDPQRAVLLGWLKCNAPDN